MKKKFLRTTGIAVLSALVLCACGSGKTTSSVKSTSTAKEASTQASMLMYGKEASNRKQEIDRQHYTIPNQRPKDKHCGKI